MEFSSVEVEFRSLSPKFVDPMPRDLRLRPPTLSNFQHLVGLDLIHSFEVDLLFVVAADSSFPSRFIVAEW